MAYQQHRHQRNCRCLRLLMRASSCAVRLRSLAAATAYLPRHGVLRCLRAAPIVLSRGHLRTTHQRAPQSPSATEEEDDLLVRLLVQDAFRPALKSTASAATTANSSAQAPPRQDVAASVDASDCSAAGGGEAQAERVSPRSPKGVAHGFLPSASAPPSRGEHSSATEGCTDTTLFSATVADCGAAMQAQSIPVVTDARSRHATAELFAVVRRVDSTVESDAMLEWLCLECQAYNSLGSGVSACGSCAASATLSYRTAKPPVRHVALMPTSWVCTECFHTNDTTSSKSRTPANAASAASAPADLRRKFWCEGCKKPFPGVQDWTCPVCHHLSPRAATQCPTCFSQRPVRWTCRGCQHSENSVFSLRCSRCGHNRPSRHSNAVCCCPACGTLNDVRWELCATCMAPLEVGGRASPTADADAAAPAVKPEAATATAVSSRPEGHNGLRGAWKAMADPLRRDARGFLRSRTVEGAQPLLLSPQPTSETEPGRASDSSVAAVAVAARRVRVPMPLLDNAWCCLTCNVPQRRNASFCDICLGSRDAMRRQLYGASEKAEGSAAAAHGAATGASVPLTADGDWRCPYCSQLRGVEVRECCGHAREVPPGYWLCEQCSSTNLNARPVCLGCGHARSLVAPWSCAACAHRNIAEAVVCGQCGLSRDANASQSTTASSVECPVCAAPNLAERLSCYRCRARLRDVEWTCHACGHGNRDRFTAKCVECAAFRTFDLSQEVWVCEVCSTGVYSGGDLPVRTTCPKCEAPRAPAAPHFPARWRCTCGMYNRARVAECPECGTQRRLPTLDTVVSCPSCFRDTKLDVAETCSHCGGSLGVCFALMDCDVTADTTGLNLASAAEGCGVVTGAGEEDEDDEESALKLASVDVL